MDEPSSDYDSPWKGALELWLESFLSMFFPDVHAAVDWTVPPEPQDSELAQLFPQDEAGRLHVDHLVKVRMRTGERCTLFLHIEVQGRDRGEFRRRMFGYRIRLHELTSERVESLALLTDSGGSGHLAHYREEGVLSGLSFWYPVARLRSFWPRWRELERSGEPICLIVLAHLASQRSRRNPGKRYNWKVRLARRILRAGLDPVTVEHLLRFVDWLLRLPRELQREYRLKRAELQEEIMGRPYVTQCEELIAAEAREKGRLEGRQEALVGALVDIVRARFGDEAHDVVIALQACADPDALRGWATLVAQDDLEVLRREIRG